MINLKFDYGAKRLTYSHVLLDLVLLRDLSFDMMVNFFLPYFGKQDIID